MVGRRSRGERSDPKPGREWLGVLLGFARIGALSFGGGSATIVAMRQLCLTRKWLTEEEFLDTVVLSRLTPGITILAQVLLIGKKVCGIRGMVAGAAGLMLPAVTITIALARLYEVVSRFAGAATPLRSVAGVAAGFAVALAVQLFRDTYKRGHRLLGPLAFLCYLGLSLLISNPVIVLVVAIVVGIAAPGLFGTKDDEDERRDDDP